MALYEKPPPILRNTEYEIRNRPYAELLSTFCPGPSSLYSDGVIDTDQELAALLPTLRAADWVALDTEADSLHAYPEKLCLIQVSLPNGEYLIDPLAPLDLTPLLD